MNYKFLLARVLGTVLCLGAPTASFAAYNDVTLVGGDTEITVAGVTFTVTAPNAVLESISVSGDAITVAMPGSSYIKLVSTSRRTLTAANRSSVSQTSSCTDSAATDIFMTPSVVSSAITFDITVDAGTCTTGTTNATGGGSSGSGGGGGGSGYYYIPPAPETPAPAAAPAATVTAPAAVAAIQAAIDRSLSKGMTNPSVRVLQQILNSDPATRIAETGAGSPGSESDFFGSATQKAVQKFQLKYGIAKPGDSGYGNVGPLTRTILNSLSGKAVAPAAPATAAPAASAPVASGGVSSGVGTISKSLTKGMTNSEVKTLQRILNSDADTRVAETGGGSPGNESTFFGPATLSAVKKFQEKHGISGPGQEGYGTIGPKTKAKLNEIGGKAGNPDKQVEDAMKQIQILQDQMKAAQ